MKANGIAATIFGLLVAIMLTPAYAQDIVVWDGPREKRDPGPGETIVTFNEYDDSFAWDAIEHLSGSRPPKDASRRDMAGLTLELLKTLPQYGQKQTLAIEPAIPGWFLEGYSEFQPTSVQRSRYFNGVIDGSLAPNADIAAIYAHWCAYDAEWFSVVRRPAFKAWLSAALLTYAPQWDGLSKEGSSGLHSRLVSPLQTKNEQYRELDNWIKNFTESDSAFVKPLVLSSLSGELAQRGGSEVDGRFLDGSAYDSGFPAHLQLSEQDFMLLAALTVTYFREIYSIEPGTKQPLHIRDFFVDAYYSKSAR